MTATPLTPQLQECVQEAYRLFARYRIGRRLTVCHCPCCMSEETETALVETPLREIPARLLSEYTNSAHGWDEAGETEIARDMRFFLPRYLQLIAQDDAPCYMGLEMCLRRLGYAHWRQNWPNEEVELLSAFFDALVRAWAVRLDIDHWPSGVYLQHDIGDVLSLVATAGGDLERALAVLEACPDPGGALHIAALRAKLVYRRGEVSYHDAILDGAPEAKKAIADFLKRSEFDTRIENALFATADADLQSILSRAV